MKNDEPEFSKTTRKQVKRERQTESTSAPRAEEPKKKGKENPMDKFIIGVILIAALAGLMYLSGANVGYQVGTYDTWSPRNYVPADGECWVAPQGDPVYDAHYAQNVNVPNCQAFESQADAHYTDAQTRAIDWQRNQSQVATSTLLFFGLAIVVFFVWVILR